MIILDTMESPVYPTTSHNSLYPPYHHVSPTYNCQEEYVSPLHTLTRNNTPSQPTSLHPKFPIIESSNFNLKFSTSSLDQENDNLIQDDQSESRRTIDNNNNTDNGISALSKSTSDHYYSEDLELVRQLQEKTKSLMDASASSRYNPSNEYQSMMYSTHTVNQHLEKQIGEQDLYQASYSMCGFRK